VVCTNAKNRKMTAPAECANGGEHVDPVAQQARAVAPVVWLLGKVQSGKTTIIRALTGATDADVGPGYRACTKDSRIFAFPAGAPLIQFLDTRGLGESRYDPSEDLAIARRQSHAVIAVMRALDQRQQAVVDALCAIRQDDPDCPIIVAQTHLHEAYRRGDQHIEPYRFPIICSHGAHESAGVHIPGVPQLLSQSLAIQRANILEMVSGDETITFVSIDFTLPSDGFETRLYGFDALVEALVDVAPSALGAAMRDVLGSRVGRHDDDHHQLIIGHALAASATDLVPLAATVAVPLVQTRLLGLLGERYGVPWSRVVALEFASALGAGLLARYAFGFGIRQLTKLIPAYGQTIGAAAAAVASFATTYALGKTAVVYLNMKSHGRVDTESIKSAWSDAFAEAIILAKERQFDAKNSKRNER
jgi:uncharacterized protein (DUF697 family)